MTDAEYLRWLADELGVAGQQHAATCARLREIAEFVEEWEEDCRAAWPNYEDLDNG